MRRLALKTTVAVAVGTLGLACAPAAAPAPADMPSLHWKTLRPGLEYTVVSEGAKGATSDAERLHVVRIDPARAPLQAVMASAGDRKARTAAEWCRERRLAVAINLGMYQADRITNVGHAHAPGHVNNAHWVAKYKSALAFGPTRAGLPPAVMLDLDTPGARKRLAEYGTVVQNLRLIRAPGRGVWSKQDRRWSEAAVATDTAGRVLFLFSRRPYSMRELNEILLALPLGIVTAMHVEGGPEASLSIHAGGIDLDLNGSFETGFNENDDEKAQWPIPNVLGVASAGPETR